MKLLFASLIVLALALTVSAQINTGNQLANALAGKPTDKKTAKPKAEKAPPALVTFDAKEAEKAERLRDKARLASSEAENLGLKIERAQTAYQKQQQDASMAQTAYVEFLRATAEKLGISKDELPNYEFDDSGGKFVLRRKEPTKPTATIITQGDNDAAKAKPDDAAKPPEPKTDSKDGD